MEGGEAPGWEDEQIRVCACVSGCVFVCVRSSGVCRRVSALN